VVTEAPSSSDGLVPLADFGAVRFTQARANGRPLGALPWSKVDMVVDGRRQAGASSLSAGGSSFTVSWRKP
jgi:hypothetical protein